MIGYLGTPREALGTILAEGSAPRGTESLGCQQGGHVCVTETTEIAACFGDVILVIDLDGLDGLARAPRRPPATAPRPRRSARPPVSAARARQPTR